MNGKSLAAGDRATHTKGSNVHTHSRERARRNAPKQTLKINEEKEEETATYMHCSEQLKMTTIH